MKLTFFEHISAIEKSISSDLISSSNFRALSAITACFPFNTASDFGFESRLASPEATCDFFLLIRKDSEGAKMIAGESEISALSPELTAHPFWQRLSALFREFNLPGSFLNLHISSFWLEFDYKDGGYEQVPNLFIKLAREDRPQSGQGWDDILETTLTQIYRILFDLDFPIDLASSIRRCLEALPPGAILYQTGFMIPRKTEAIRLVLSRLHPDDLPGFLNRIGWPGNPDEIRNTEARYISHFLYPFYDLNIGQSVLPCLGTELFFRYGRQPQWDPAWHQAFDMLQSDGMLLKEKRDGMVSFCGKKNRNQYFPIYIL